MEYWKTYMIIKVANHPNPLPPVDTTLAQADGCLSSVAWRKQIIYFNTDIIHKHMQRKKETEIEN